MFYNVTIAGKEYPIAFNFNALSAFGRKKKYNFSQVINIAAHFGELDMDELLVFVFCLFEEGSKVAGKELEVDEKFLGENLLNGNVWEVLNTAIEEGMATGKQSKGKEKIVS